MTAHQVCQSSGNIYYQSDKSLLAAIQICLLTADLSCLIPETVRASPTTLSFRLYDAETGSRRSVEISTSLPKLRRQVPGLASQDEHISVRALDQPASIQHLLALLEKAVVKLLCASDYTRLGQVPLK